MDIYDYLKKDHKKVSELFSEIIAAKKSERREEFFNQVIKEILLHAESEHETFYKSLKQHSESKEEAQHGDKEHAEIKEAIAKLVTMPSESIKWFVQFGELKSLVEHHVEEEEGEMFKAAKKVLSKKVAEELVDEIEKRKQELKKASIQL